MAIKTLVLMFTLYSASAFAAFPGRGVCSGYKSSTRSCFLEYPSGGVQRARCEVCREDKSCFLAFNGVGTIAERGLCETYREGKNCFFIEPQDRPWCSVIKGEKSCFLAFNGDAVNRERCEREEFPFMHIFWSN